jgi:serine beta-lactamase-like protein LACTB
MLARTSLHPSEAPGLPRMVASALTSGLGGGSGHRRAVATWIAAPVLTCALAASGLAAQVPTTSAEFGERTSRIAELLQAFVDSSPVPGVSVAVGVGDDLTWVQAFGYADLDAHRRMTPDTRVRIGSVSKSLTAVALAQLVLEGTLDLDVPIQRYVPEFPDKGVPITARQLATHQAGIRHYRGDEAYSHEHFASVLDAISVFANDTLVARPGSTVSYSTYGYTLLSAAMERAAGEPFLSLMSRRVTTPLGMTHTGPETAGTVVPDQATGYELSNGEPAIPPDVDLSSKWAGGGFVSTAGDLLTFARAHLQGDAITPKMRELLWTPSELSNGTKTPFGIGWQVARDPGGRRMMVSGGSAIGGTAVVFVFPDDAAVVVVLTNMGNAPIRGVPLRVARVLLGDATR